VTPPWWCNTN